MNRRSLLRSGAAALGGGTAVGVAISLADDADAAASTALAVDGDSVTLDADGEVAAVELTATVEWSYDLPDGAQPQEVVVDLAAAEAGDEMDVVASDTEAQIFPEADGSASLTADLLAAGVVADAALDPAAGESTSVDIEVEAAMTVVGGDGDLAAAESRDSATVSVERDAVELSAFGDVGGSASLTVETQ